MKKYYEDAKYNAAFVRCVDVMSHASVCQHRKTCYQRFGGERIYTQETALA